MRAFAATFSRILTVLVTVLGCPSAARAVDPFEIQVYDATVGEPGRPALELHINSVISGQRDAVPPELPPIASPTSRPSPRSGSPAGGRWACMSRPRCWPADRDLGVRGGAWYVSVNPILDLSFARLEAPSFEPATTVLYVIGGLLSAGIEYYANLGPVGGWLPPGEQQHYLFEVINVLAWKHVRLNVGIGEGLTGASNDFVGKMIVGFR